VDQYDIVAVILGVMFTLRKLDAQSREAAQFPQVSESDFLRWQRMVMSAYRTGSWGCFMRVIFHFGFMRYLVHHPISNDAFRHTALLVDLAWLTSVVTCFVRARSAGNLRKKLGITLEKPQPTR